MPTAVPKEGETLSLTDPLHNVQFNPNPRCITWERLEKIRLQKLGLGSERYSRHFQRFQGDSVVHSSSMPFKSATVRGGEASNHRIQPRVVDFKDVSKSNSLAPFYTVGKPTCGYFFSRETDNKKVRFGIPATDLVKWRSNQQ